MNGIISNRYLLFFIIILCVMFLLPLHCNGNINNIHTINNNKIKQNIFIRGGNNDNWSISLPFISNNKDSWRQIRTSRKDNNYIPQPLDENEMEKYYLSQVFIFSLLNFIFILYTILIYTIIYLKYVLHRIYIYIYTYLL